MRKLRTSVFALTTIASLTIGGTAVAGAETANGSSDKVTASSSKLNLNSSNKNEADKQDDGQKNSTKSFGSSTMEGDKDQNGSVKFFGSSNKDEADKQDDGQKNSAKSSFGSSTKEGDKDQNGSMKNFGSSNMTDADKQDATNKGSVDGKKGWVPGHSFGSTLQTDFVPVWAKIWMAVVAVVGIITAGLFAAPGITALRAHHIIP